MLLSYRKLLIVHLALHAARALNLVADYSGSSFFNKWNFYGNYDNLTSGKTQNTYRGDSNLINGPTGDVIWVDRTNATTDNLAFVNAAGHAIIKVDNTSNVTYLDKRNSVHTETLCLPFLFSNSDFSGSDRISAGLLNGEHNYCRFCTSAIRLLSLAGILDQGN